MMPCEDAEFPVMKLADPEALTPDQDDVPTPYNGNYYIGMEVLLPRGDGYQNKNSST